MTNVLPPVQSRIGATVDAYFVDTTGKIARADSLAVEAVNFAHWADYAFPMEDPQAVGLFVMPNAGAFPAVPIGVYNRYVRVRASVNAAPTDGSIGADGPWSYNGSGILPSPPPGINPPGSVKIYGFQYTGINFVPVIDRVVSAQLVGPPGVLSTTVLERSDRTTNTDGSGMWQFLCVTGTRCRIFIPEAGIDVTFVVPAVDTNIVDLL